MEEMKKCRICLQNVGQLSYSLKDIAHFQQVTYEKIYLDVTNLNSIVRGPQNLCWICAEDLLAAYDLKKRCEMSEALFIIKTELCDIDIPEPKFEMEIAPENVVISHIRTRNSREEKIFGSPIREKVESQSDHDDIESSIECPYCLSVFKSKEDRINHCRLKHMEKLKKCTEPDCSFEYFFPTQFAWHLRKHEKPESNEPEKNVFEKPTIKCNDCAEVFCNERLLRKHCRTIHGMSDSYDKSKEKTICAHCGKELGVYSLDSHILNFHTDGLELFFCDFCGRTFKNRTSLLVHMKRRHMTHQKQYSCRYCSEIFKNTGTRRTHEVRFHTKNFNHSCGICGMKFIETGTLRKHMVTHTGDKNFCCEKCSARFGTKASLSRHLQTHTDVKAFHCQICDAAFKTSKSLYSHSAIHQEKKYECPVCGQKFFINQQMRQHVKNKHPEYELPPPGTVMNKTARERMEKIKLKKMQLSLVKDFE